MPEKTIRLHELIRQDEPPVRVMSVIQAYWGAPEASFSTSSSLTPRSPGVHIFLPSPHPTLAPRCTTPLSQDGGRRGKIRLKWLRRPQPCLETHIRRTVRLDE